MKPRAESAVDIDDEITKSERKREANEVLRLAQAIVDLKHSEYQKAPIDEDLRVHTDLARRIDAHIAKKRQIAFVAKQLRKRDDLETLFAAVDKPKTELKKETARMHRLERWREKLIDEGDSALSAYLALNPHADRQALRSLARAAATHRTRQQAAIANDQPAIRNDGSFSALYQMLAELEKSHVGDQAEDEADGDVSAENT
jgi:ribosome-associated protein